jgi:hypothetical protein
MCVKASTTTIQESFKSRVRRENGRLPTAAGTPEVHLFDKSLVDVPTKNGVAVKLLLRRLGLFVFMGDCKISGMYE